MIILFYISELQNCVNNSDLSSESANQLSSYILYGNIIKERNTSQKCQKFKDSSIKRLQTIK